MTTVIYHSADYDGIFCREIAKHFLGEKDVQFIGWNFGDQPLFTNIPVFGDVYFMDLPIDRPMGFDFSKPETVIERFGDVHGIKEFNQRLIWIDHHKSSIESHPTDIKGYRIDGVAACRLAWQWFECCDGNAIRRGHEIGIPIRLTGVLPMVQDFKSRNIVEPLSVYLAGEYDVNWKDRPPEADVLQFGLRLVEQGADFWEALLDTGSVGEKAVEELLENGRIAQRYSQKIDADLVKYKSFRMKWEGLDFLCLNTGRFNSLTFAALDKPETGHDALLGFMWNGHCWTISMYHAKHRTDLDLSAIAVKYGGGGHRGACGFTCVKLPFPNWL